MINPYSTPLSAFAEALRVREGVVLDIVRDSQRTKYHPLKVDRIAMPRILPSTDSRN